MNNMEVSEDNRLFKKLNHSLINNIKHFIYGIKTNVYH